MQGIIQADGQQITRTNITDDKNINQRSQIQQGTNSREILLIGRKEVSFRHWPRYANSRRKRAGSEEVEFKSTCRVGHFFLTTATGNVRNWTGLFCCCFL